MSSPLDAPAPIPSSTCTNAVEVSQQQQQRRARRKPSEEFPEEDNAYDCCHSLSYKGQAELWEMQVDAWDDEDYKSCSGYGCLSRVTYPTAAAINIPLSLFFSTLCGGCGLFCCACGLLECTLGGLRAFICCCDKPSQKALECGGRCCVYGGETGCVSLLMLASVIYNMVRLPGNILCPEVQSCIGQHEGTLALSKASHSLRQGMKSINEVLNPGSD